MTEIKNPVTKLGNLRTYIKRWGVLRCVYGLVMVVASRVGIHVFAVRKHIMESEPAYPATLSSLNIRELKPAELFEASADPTLYMDREFVEAALSRGDLAFGAFDGEVLVSYLWRAAAAAPHTERIWVRVAKPHGYAYKSFTRLAYRGKGINPVLLIFSNTIMLKLGFTHRVGFIDVTNFASLAASNSTGSRTIGHAGYLDWFGWVLPVRTKAAKEIGFEFFERD